MLLCTHTAGELKAHLCCKWLESGESDPHDTFSFSPLLPPQHVTSPPICRLQSCNDEPLLRFSPSFFLDCHHLLLRCIRSRTSPLFLPLHSVLKLSLFFTSCYHTSLPLPDPLLFITMNNTRLLLALEVLPLLLPAGRDP